MKIALVTTPWSSRSGIADYTRHLLPYLREEAEVELFVEVGREGQSCGNETPRSVAELEPREFDQILYQLGNEAQHAFMVPMVRNLGGTVVLHDWVLFDLAMAAFPALSRGGLGGWRRAYSEGGVAQAMCWRRSRKSISPATTGWFPMEGGGRWSAARGPLPAEEASALRLQLHVPEGRTWSVVQGQRVLDSGSQAGDVVCEVDLSGDQPVDLLVEGAQRAGRDDRHLGVFMGGLKCKIAGAWVASNLDALLGTGESGLAVARFQLPLNHSIVRHADAFLVHSDVVAERVLESRNAVTPIYRVHHGVEPRWREGSRAASRDELGLDGSWADCFLLATFGALQQHKRPEVLLDALADVRGRGHDVRLLCVGEERPTEFDFAAAVSERGLANAVHVSGWLAEERAWDALHGSDLCVNLRGPSTGGTSGGASQALSLGRAVIVSELPEMNHFPEDCVLRLAQGAGEAQRLADTIESLCTDPERLAAMETAARRAVTEELHWRLAAQRYIQLMRTYPKARASRRSIVVRFLHATAKEKADV